MTNPNVNDNGVEINVFDSINNKLLGTFSSIRQAQRSLFAPRLSIRRKSPVYSRLFKTTIYCHETHSS